MAMIHESTYIKSILRKFLDGTASPLEMTRLKVAVKLYEEEEMLSMIRELLMEKEATSLSESLKDWQPTPKEVLDRGKGAGSWLMAPWLNRFARIAAIYLLPVTAITLLLMTLERKSYKKEILCDGLSANTEIPTSQFNCHLQLADGRTITIDSNFTGNKLEVGNVRINQDQPGVISYTWLNNTARTAISKEATHKISTPAQQQYDVHFPDGSRIRLNATSTLTIPAGFAPNHKLVELKGEAYFNITNVGNTPFIIRTGNATIEIQQAQFNLKTTAYRTMVAMEKGNMKVRGQNSSQQMDGQNGVLIYVQQYRNVKDPKDTIFYFRDQDIDQLLTWRMVKRVYDNIPIRDFVVDMARWYGLQLDNLNCIPESNMEAALCYKAPLDQALGILRQKGLRIYHTGNRITFCQPLPQQPTIALRTPPANNPSLKTSIAPTHNCCW